MTNHLYDKCSKCKRTFRLRRLVEFKGLLYCGYCKPNRINMEPYIVKSTGVLKGGYYD